MKKIVTAIVAIMFAIPVFSQNNKIPVNKKESASKTKAPDNNPNYKKDAVKQSKKEMNAQVNKFHSPKHQKAVKGKNAKKAAKGGQGG